MNQLLSLFFIVILTACAQGPQTQNDKPPQRSLASVHETVFPHTHKHGTNCGHETKTVGFDTVYIHDGHLHKVHGDHVDNIQE